MKYKSIRSNTCWKTLYWIVETWRKEFVTLRFSRFFFVWTKLLHTSTFIESNLFSHLSPPIFWYLGSWEKILNSHSTSITFLVIGILTLQALNTKYIYKISLLMKFFSSDPFIFSISFDDSSIFSPDVSFCIFVLKRLALAWFRKFNSHILLFFFKV